EMRHYITVAIAIDFALSEKTIEKINELYKDNESDLNIPRIVCMNKSSHSKLFFITFNFKKNKLIISEMESEISKEKQKEFFKNFSEINHYEF
ncbi:MAG: hypothetical protein NZZ41_07820, partial [Candidatus Dojkabacteria bacterium]|nr:hypothetical protein [Candidatus Dojkabacteria bacterium]